MSAEQNIWQYLHDILDYGASVSIVVTKTGIENELTVAFYPTPNLTSGPASPILPAIFTASVPELNKKIIPTLKTSQFSEATKIFKNQEMFDSLVSTYKIIHAAANRVDTKRGRSEFFKLQGKARAHWKLEEYEKALAVYTQMRSVLKTSNPEVEERIALCLEYVSKKKVEKSPEPEQHTDPFAKKEGFGKIPEENE